MNTASAGKGKLGGIEPTVKWQTSGIFEECDVTVSTHLVVLVVTVVTVVVLFCPQSEISLDGSLTLSTYHFL